MRGPETAFAVQHDRSPIRDISVNDESYEGIKKEGASQTRGGSVVSGHRANVCIHRLQPSARLPQPAPVLPGQDSKGLRAKHAVPRCSLPRERCVRDGIKREIQFPGNTGSKKPWILREALIPRSCKAVFWGFSHRMRRMEIH